MKALDILKNFALAAVIASVSVQCAKEEITPDGTQDSGRKVTLTLRSAEPDTKTWLGEGGKVMWAQGDKVRINGRMYEVIPDEDDPSSASVSDVYESREYLAAYPESVWDDGNNYIVQIPNFQNNGDWHALIDLKENNPMLGYTAGSELVLHNMAAIIRLGITGSGQQIGRITLVRNDGEPVAGELMVPVDDMKSGEYADTYDNFRSDEYDHPYKYVTLDANYVTLGTEPSYFYIAVAPDTYPEGFTVYVVDSEGNYAIQSTYQQEDVFRSTITAKTTFEFKAFTETPEINITETGPISVSCTVSGHRGAYIKAVAIPKTQWDSYYAEYPEAGVNDVLWREGDLYQIGADGTVSFDAGMAYNEQGTEINMAPDTEYMIVVGYVELTVTEGNNYISNTGVYAVASTSSAMGEAPDLAASLAPGNRFDRLDVSIHAPEAAGVCYALVSAADYQRYHNENLDDAAIIEQYGHLMSGEDLEAATGAGFFKTVMSSDFSLDIGGGMSYEIFPATEYVLVVSALSHGGKSSLTASTATTSLHIDPDAEWSHVSEGSLYIECQDNGATYEGTVAVEKMSGRSIYRFVSPMNQDEAFISSLGNSYYAMKLSDSEEHYLYLDLSDRDRVFFPPFENYIGFSTDSEYTARPYELFITEYEGWADVGPYHVSMQIYPAVQYYNENYMVLETYSSLVMRIEFDVPEGTGLNAGGSNESFDIEDEVPWQ